jgi:hypothetical protein
MRALLVLLTALAPVACVTAPKPVPTVDATCDGACARGAALECAWSAPTKAGHTCIEVCENATTQGQMWRLGCLATITSCDQPCP